MTIKALRVLLSGVLLSLLALGSGAVTTGYIEQSQISLNLSGPNTVRCNRSATIRAKVISNSNGRPVRNQIVRWRLSGTQSRSDGLSASTSTTNRNGVATVRLSFGPVAGRRTVTASSANVSPSITVRCAGGLPATSVRPPDDYTEQPDSVLLRPGVEVASLEAGPLPASRVRLGRLGIDLPLIEGDGYTVPEGVASHYPDTAWPDEGSNTYIYAHAREGNFLELWQVRTGDLVEIDMTDGRVIPYRVSEIVPVVEWDALEYLAPTDTERVTLQTSLWYDDTAPRFIVIAERVAGA